MQSLVNGKKKKGWPRLLAVAILLLLTGCGKMKTGGTVSVITPDFFGIGEELAVNLTANHRHPKGKGERVIVTTFVDVDNLYRTSRFGRTLTEALSTRLFGHGFGVIEVRKAAALLMKSDQGEMVLTRDAELLARQHEADSIVAGTYSLTPNSVIVNVKLLDCDSQEVLSATGIEIQRSRNINYLLSDSAGIADAELSVYERGG